MGRFWGSRYEDRVRKEVLEVIVTAGGGRGGESEGGREVGKSGGLRSKRIKWIEEEQVSNSPV